jgi:hypothetical protein
MWDFSFGSATNRKQTNTHPTGSYLKIVLSVRLLVCSSGEKKLSLSDHNLQNPLLPDHTL